MRNPPVVLGIDFGGTKIAAAVCDLAGNKLGSAVVDSLGERGARVSFDHGVHTAKALLAESARGANLAAVGVATFGIPFDDRVELAPAISDWTRWSSAASFALHSLAQRSSWRPMPRLPLRPRRGGGRWRARTRPFTSISAPALPRPS